MTTEPQPIETAPKDGTAILTDCGVARFSHYTGRQPQWSQCDGGGDDFRCADEGYFYCQPRLWTPLPQWVKG